MQAMNAQQHTPAALDRRTIQYLSTPMPVSMGDFWFDIATSNHFWIRRRFDVMRKLADSVIRNARRCGEIGCGNGLLQKDLEDRYGISVAGFELNEVALQKNISRASPLYCYNVLDCRAEFQSRFDLLFLFDVLEHIENESAFLRSVKFHLAEHGILLINVPALEFFRSDYDRSAGHIRRYSANQLSKVCASNGFKATAISYWGLPLIPLLLLRKGLNHSGKEGMDARGLIVNSALSFVAKWEPIPQRLLGTSVMAVLENQS